MKVINELNIYEIDGLKVSTKEVQVLKINSHWNYSDRVVLEIDDLKITVLVSDLQKAIQNASNHRSY